MEALPDQINLLANAIKEKRDAGNTPDEVDEMVTRLAALKIEYQKSTGVEWQDNDQKEGEVVPDVKTKVEGGLSKKELRKQEKLREAERRKAEKQAQLEAQKKLEEENDVSKGNYGISKLNQSAERPRLDWRMIGKLGEDDVGKPVILRARAHNVRGTGKQCFIVLRQSYETLQAICAVDDHTSRLMVKFCTSINKESLLVVEGVLQKAPTPIYSCSQKDYELRIQKVFVTSAATPQLPFLVEDASVPDSELEKPNSVFKPVYQDVRLDNRVIDLRTPANQAIFRLQGVVCRLFRDYLLENDFAEIHTPKIISTASEGGANVFKCSYFKGNAYLAQSPQFYKQMAICGDMRRVFEIGPVFRAEDSNTHRHLTEFTGLDMEMEINEHYHEILDLVNGMFVHIFNGLKDHAHELEIVSQQYPFEPFQFLEEAPRLDYLEGVKMLAEAGVEMDPTEDLTTANERLLGELVKKKYGTDFYMLDKFPMNVRPFYTMPDPEDPTRSNSYDMFMRGEEIISGAQRIHDPELLAECVTAKGVDVAQVQSYIDAFKYGAPPHGGIGIGLERVLMLYLNLGNVRKTSMFPRDPKRLNP